jgi:hypothetical protein
MPLGEARCQTCGGEPESRNGCSRCGKALARFPRVFPDMQRMPVEEALRTCRIALCEDCGWRQTNLKPVTEGGQTNGEVV